MLLVAVDEPHRLVCQLLYGAGLRLMECLMLRVKDLDFDRKTWHWVFPSPTLSIDPRTKVRRRHHQYEHTVGRALSQAVARSQIPKK